MVNSNMDIPSHHRENTSLPRDVCANLNELCGTSATRFFAAAGEPLLFLIVLSLSGCFFLYLLAATSNLGLIDYLLAFRSGAYSSSALICLPSP